MPIYDYVCHHCGHRFEVIHGIHDTGPTECPVCHSHEVRKGFVAPTFVFKGSGWAKKDRRPSAKPSESKSGEPASGDKKAGDGAGTDSAATASDGDRSAAAGSSSKPEGASATPPKPSTSSGDSSASTKSREHG